MERERERERMRPPLLLSTLLRSAALRLAVKLSKLGDHLYWGEGEKEAEKERRTGLLAKRTIYYTPPLLCLPLEKCISASEESSSVAAEKERDTFFCLCC